WKHAESATLQHTRRGQRWWPAGFGCRGCRRTGGGGRCRWGPGGAGLQGARWWPVQAVRGSGGGAGGGAGGGPGRRGWDEDQRWTLARIAEVIRRRFMVDYTLAGLDLLLHRIGWSVQVPAPQASERDEERVTAWKQETWPVITGG